MEFLAWINNWVFLILGTRQENCPQVVLCSLQYQNQIMCVSNICSITKIVTYDNVISDPDTEECEGAAAANEIIHVYTEDWFMPHLLAAPSIISICFKW